jgi:hypothetical protein
MFGGNRLTHMCLVRRPTERCDAMHLRDAEEYLLRCALVLRGQACRSTVREQVRAAGECPERPVRAMLSDQLSELRGQCALVLSAALVADIPHLLVEVVALEPAVLNHLDSGTGLLLEHSERFDVIRV